MTVSDDHSIFFNQSTTPLSPLADTSSVQTFHQQLRSYEPTPLVPLEGVAKELGVRSVFLKDEGNRLGLPSFKILGASWGTYRALASRLGLPRDSPLADVSRAARQRGIVLFAATEGNHGRAVAAMARILNLPAHIYVPSTVNGADVRLIREEGAKVILTGSHYDDAIAEAFSASKSTDGGLLVQDNSFEGYEQIPAWIVEGYSTLLTEVGQQLSEQGLDSTLIVSPVGVGSLAHAVVSYCKAEGRQKCRVMSVEPDTAPCLHQSLRSGQPVPIRASETATIMDGLNCGTVSKEAFGDLRAGVDVSVVVSDIEAHQAVMFLEDVGVRIGPCGAATLAGLWKLGAAEVAQPRGFLSEDAVVVLLGTEGQRKYRVPVRHEDVSAAATEI
ncbi:related to diaminopropionate ammonia-lyase [Cephalotrichum gorgonifer]|uniref:Related to diaminopropionate ammonia-lyase n=1 Tax=Cephalotrichum gorgonifer TaxID=2041049 RepID=A0AAE8N6X8_9PEZI|nr:related to diaminopropionate ammonia-lyase [Cephalotrichum gorgonifer]